MKQQLLWLAALALVACASLSFNAEVVAASRETFIYARSSQQDFDGTLLEQDQLQEDSFNSTQDDVAQDQLQGVLPSMTSSSATSTQSHNFARNQKPAWASKSAFTLFQAWVAKHKKVWESMEEMEHRFRIFADNLHYIETRNREVGSYRLGLNRFADLTHDEFQRAYRLGGYVNHHVAASSADLIYVHTGGYVNNHATVSSTLASRRQAPSDSPRPFMYNNVTDIPKSMDWRKKGALTEIKDQGQCGSCWAFSTVATVEAVNQIATGHLISLSEQELVDCDRAYNQGCNGGLMDYAFEFIVANGGLDTESDYPYKETDGICDTNKKNSHVVSIDGYEDVPNSNEDALLKAVAHQPVSVAIDAGGRDMQLYDGGIFTGSCGKELNHAVVAVGYDTGEDGMDYWIVKNSWGQGWGEQGYFKMERKGAADRDGLCGINMEPSYPIKKNGPGPTPPSPSPPGPTPTPPPPPPKPEPVVCDEESSCPAGTTCCCEFGFEDYCFLWGCCPAPSATCCDDSDYCCPSDHPICDLDSGSCLSSPSDPIGVNLLRRLSATRRTPESDRTRADQSRFVSDQ